MSEVIITVRGEHEMRAAPEEGVIRLSVRAEGGERGPVVERIAALAEPLRTELESRREQGSLREWASQRVAVWADRPWSSDGKQLALVHHASVEFTATFTDFAALSWWAAEVAGRDGIQIDEVTWQLTRDTARRAEADVAAAAVGAAVERATAYATALGLASVTPLEVADVGLLSRAEAGSAPEPMMMRAAFAADSSAGAGFDLQPEDIVVTAAVEARFTAR